MNLQPKAGRLGTGAYGVAIKGDPFAPTPSPSPPTGTQQGGLYMPEDRTSTVYQHPLQGRRNVSKSNIPPARPTFYASLTTVSKNPSIQPHEKGKFFNLHTPSLGRTKFGAAGTEVSDTAFHRNPKPAIPNPAPRSALDSTHVYAVSFHSENNLWFDPNNSFLGSVPSPTSGRTGTGRWNITKKGVV